MRLTARNDVLTSERAAKVDPGTLSQMLVDGSEREDLLVQALKECQAAMDAGEPIDREPILAKYPAIRGELSACLEGLALVQPAASATESSVNTTIGQLNPSGTLGDFRILREIGKGGMGVVYEAEQISIGRRVALKVLPYAAMLDKRQVARFQNEARAAATLEHPNIVPVYFVGNERGVYYYAMRLINGKNLAEVLQELRGNASSGSPLSQIGSRLTSLRSEASRREADSGSTPAGPATADTVRNKASQNSTSIATDHSTKGRVYFESVARLAKQTAEALDFAHSHGIIHRDIKPANIMLDEVGDAWVTDFGLARIESDVGMTMTGDLVGTLRYMSPEQTLAKRITVDHRSDVYSLGATLYELLTLQPLFDGADRATLLKKIAFDDPKPPSKIVSGVPKDLETIVFKSLHKSPDDRYATAQEFAADLERFIGRRPIVAKPPSTQDRLRKWIQRNSTIAAVIAACLIAIATVSSIAGVGAIRAYQRERGQKELAVQAKTDAESSQAETRRALLAEQLARQTALENLVLSKKNLYRAHLRETQAAIREGRVNYAESLLYQYIPEPGTTDHRGWEWYHLLEKLEGGSQMFARLSDSVGQAFWSPDHSKIAAVTSGGDAYLWDSKNHELIRKLHVPYGRFRGAEFSPDSQTLAISGIDSVVRLWNTNDGQLSTYKPSVPSYCGRRPSWHPNGTQLVYGNHDGVYALNIQNGTETCVASAKTHIARWSPDGKQIAYGEYGYFGIIDAASNQVSRTFKPHGHDLWIIDWASDGVRLATGSFDYRAKIVNSLSGEVLHDFLHDSGVNIVAFSPDESQLACGTAGQNIVVWDIDSNDKSFELVGSRDWVNALSWSADAKQILGAGSDRCVRIWNTPSQLGTEDRSFRSRVHSKTGRVVYTLKDNQQIAVRDLLTGELLLRANGKNAFFHETGESILIKDRTVIRQVQIGSKNELGRFSVPAGHYLPSSREQFWSSDGKVVATSPAGEKKLFLWEATSGRELGHIDLQNTQDTSRSSRPPKTIWAPSGSLLAIVKTENVEIWDANTCKQLSTIRDEQLYEEKRFATWSPNGNTITTYGWDGVINLWDARTGLRLHRLVGHTVDRFINHVAWSPDGSLLASGGHDQKVKVWNTQTGVELHSLAAHTSRIRHLAFDPSGTRLASADDSGTVRLWETDSGAELLTLAEDLGPRSLTWTGDGQSLVAASTDTNSQLDDAPAKPRLVILGASGGYELQSNGELAANFAARKFLEGLELAMSGRGTDSNVAFGVAEKLVGPQAWARYRRGRINAAQARTHEALEDFELASSLPISSSQVRNELAWLLANHPETGLREPARAERIARGLLTEWPQSGEFWGTLAMTLLRQARWQEASKALEKADELSVLGKSKVRWMQAICQYNLGNPDEAQASLDAGSEIWEREEGYDSGLCFDSEDLRAEAELLLGAPTTTE